MTTLTLRQNVNFKRTRFENIEELRDYINVKLGNSNAVDFRPLTGKEITQALKKKMTTTKKLKGNRFTNLTRQHAR
jgi:hypothetical protein